MISLLAFTAAAASGWPSSTYEDFSSDDSRRVMRELAKCMVGSSKSGAAQIVDVSLGDPAAWKFSIRPDCLPMPMVDPMRAMFGGSGLALRARPIQYRYALAEELLRRAYRQVAPIIPANAPRLTHEGLPANTPQPAKWPGDGAQWAKYIESTQQDARVSAFGECVVRASPAESWGLLTTEIASPAETEAFKALTPAFAGCIKVVGAMPRGKFNVRGTIALDFYRLAQMPSAAAVSKEAAR